MKNGNFYLLNELFDVDPFACKLFCFSVSAITHNGHKNYFFFCIENKIYEIIHQLVTV